MILLMLLLSRGTAHVFFFAADLMSIPLSESM